MAVCCCSLAGTAACQHCAQNPFATDVWTNKTVTVDHIDATPFGNGFDVCPVCGKPSTIGKPQTNYDSLISKTPEELAEWVAYNTSCETCPVKNATDYECHNSNCGTAWLLWLKAPAEVDE